jgi:hypothetical protein
VPRAPADFVALRGDAVSADVLLADASRRDVALVTVGGRPLAGDGGVRAVFEARGVDVAPIVLDGAPRLLSADLACRVDALPEREPGLERRRCA